MLAIKYTVYWNQDITERRTSHIIRIMRVFLNKMPFYFIYVKDPRAILDVDEFVLSKEQIWRNLALHHLLTNRSSAVNGCRQNESSNSRGKHHNYPPVIHMTPVFCNCKCDLHISLLIETRWLFPLEKAILWIEDLNVCQKQWCQYAFMMNCFLTVFHLTRH